MCVVCEATKYQKKYKCPYCDKRLERMDLVAHVDKKHQDMIPDGYTATRVVFNLINKKEYGTCVICGEETEWDEDKARYNRFCGSKKCHDQYVKTAHKNTNIEQKLKDPMFQQKMLAGRSISGVYTFADGGKVSYTGSYERRLLEFMDKMLNIKSYDVLSPGPVIEYEFEGEKHFWITDQIYLPYKLVFDVKDGGSNPNNREMDSYRAKQIAKEKAIEEQGEYNYIRLTDNNFEQLIEIMLMLKEQLVDPDTPQKPIIKINENYSTVASALPPANVNNVYIVDRLKKNTFTGDNGHEYYLCRDYMQDAISAHGGELDKIPFEDLKEMNVRLFKYNGYANYMDILENAHNGTDFYKYLTGKELLDSEQLEFDNSFTEVMPYTEFLSIMEGSLISSIKQSMGISSCLYEGVQIPSFELEHLNEKYSSVKFYRDLDGIFLMNEDTRMRTKSYTDIDILKKFKYTISNMILN